MLASSVTESTASAAAARSSATSQGTPGLVGSQLNTAAPKEVATIGKNSAFPWGIVQVRLTALPNEPAKNHTCPLCPSAQWAPVSSRAGLTAAGMENTHCDHRALHSP